MNESTHEEVRSDRTEGVLIGIDVGSTTVKATVVDPRTEQILWSDYLRHNTRQAECVLEFLVRIGQAFPHVPMEAIRVFVTGSGSKPIGPHIGAKFVQEVNSVTMAVERLHPDVLSVVELGGQDAKIIMFKQNEAGDRSANASMNDKCASGTGATIDKCMIKVGMPFEDIAQLHFDPTKLHHVAAKCGVFAETDIVNLVKSGIPSAEIMCSLADAIVLQNLSVLTRGSTLKPKVLLLGGPNTYLPFLQECWRLRIPETWESRGFEYPRDVPIEELIIVPDNAQYYAAFGAAIYGSHEPADVGVYKGVDGLKEFINHGRQVRLGEGADGPLARDTRELERFREEFSIPRFVSATFQPGEVVEAILGLDGGSTSSKCVLVDREGRILMKEYTLSKGNPIQDAKDMLDSLRRRVAAQGAELRIVGFGATGYAADVLEESMGADVNIVETVAHMMSATAFFPDADVICDIGGQDIKVLFMRNGHIRNFRLSNQCSAGNGMLLQAMADQFGIDVRQYADTAFGAQLAPKFSYGCAVFLDSDRVNFQKEGYSKEELLAGLAKVLPKNVWQYVVQIPRLAELGNVFVLQGGTQHNLAAVKAQVDYIKERVPGGEVRVHPHTGEAGAHGAAMEALRVVGRRGFSTFIGLDEAIGIKYTSINDETTTCHFCPNNCSRTFIDTETPDGRTSRYISGFSCEKGTVEDLDALKTLQARRNQLRKQFPNLVDYEAKLAFRQFFKPDPMPEAGSYVDDKEVQRGLFWRVKRRIVSRPFERSPAEAWKRRRDIRIGIPRVLNIWSTAPFFRTYLESVGIAMKNVVFSDTTTEEMWIEGGKYGSIDPCYPSKVAQAHVHNLLFHHHSEDKPLQYIFFPCITRVRSTIEKVMDTTSCPIVAGAPNVIKAAFTKEVDFFATRGITYLDPSVTFAEPNLLKQNMFDCFGPILGLTRDESDHACDQGWRALDQFKVIMEEKGKEIIEQVEAEGEVALLMIGRPYHSDPGLNHEVLEEFQALGFPVLSMNSIPTDKQWLRKYFEEDIQRGRVESPLEVTDVWPENYSANSVMKVWAAKFAAHCPNVAVLDLSSFKCGHDAPTYGLIDQIITAAGTPYSALHDIDANKPSGSIKIRVKTFAHSLHLHQERLKDDQRRRAELAFRLEERRAELLQEKLRRDAAAGHGVDTALLARIEESRQRAEAHRRRAEALSPRRPAPDGSTASPEAPASAPAAPAEATLSA